VHKVGKKVYYYTRLHGHQNIKKYIYNCMFRRKLATTGQHEERRRILHVGVPASSQTGALTPPWNFDI
jgi:hypothetical protein